MTEKINGYQLYNAFLAGYIHISENREYMNKINVFPVQDGDTGTNMVGTFKKIALNLVSCKSAGTLLERIARLSLEGARGNSGMIVSQYLNGLALYGKGRESFTLHELGEIFLKSIEDAYGAVESPQEGTILTVMSVWATTISQDCLNKKNIEYVLSHALLKAKDALEQTPDQLAVLKEHNVVDAGAWGFVNFVEGIVNLGINGRVPWSKRKDIQIGDLSFTPSIEREVHSYNQDLTYRYCTEVLLEGENLGQRELKECLKSRGDSLIISSGGGRARIHIHTNEPHKVLSDLRKLGRIIQQKADDMIRQEQIVNRILGKIGVVTDSIADIPQELLDKYQIHVINLSLIWDEEEYLDRLTLRPVDFYRMQTQRDSFPTSSIPTSDQVESYYQYLLEHYEGLIILPVARELSGTWQRMTLSAEKFNKDKKRIVVIDTCLNSVAQGLLVKNIAQKASRGAELNELVDASEELKKRIKIYVTVKTFKYMVKGGRVSPLKGLIANILNLKPIVSLDEKGKGVAFDKSFSSRGLMKKIARIVQKTAQNDGIEEYAIVHASDRDRADNFTSLIRDIILSEPSYITDISPIVGMHSGKGAVAIGIVESHGKR